MGTLIAFEWTSLDGVFDADNMEEWFFPYNSAVRQKLIKETYSQADAFLMGRNTYEMLAPSWGGLDDDAEDGVAGILTHTPKFIASNGPIVASWGETTLVKDDVIAEIKKLKQKSNILLIGSGKLAESLAEAGLIDEYKMLVHPYVVGEGRQFFSKNMKSPLELAGVKKLEGGLVVLDYKVTR